MVCQRSRSYGVIVIIEYLCDAIRTGAIICHVWCQYLDQLRSDRHIQSVCISGAVAAVGLGERRFTFRCKFCIIL